MKMASDRVVTSFSKSIDVFDIVVVVAHAPETSIALLDLQLLVFHYSAWLAKLPLQEQSQLSYLLTGEIFKCS